MSKNGKKSMEVIHKHLIEKSLNPDDDEDIEEVEKLKDELKETKEALGERETQLGIIAKKKFEEESKVIKEKMKREFNRTVEIQSPEQLEVFRGLLEQDDESDDGESPSIHQGGSDLSKTGGSVPLEAPTKGATFRNAREVIKALYDAYEEEKFKQETGREFNAERLGKLEKQLDILWSHIRQGFEARGFDKLLGENPKGLGAICRKCGSVTFSRICENCGHETMSEKEWHQRGRR